MSSHACNLYCAGDVHCELVYGARAQGLCPPGKVLESGWGVIEVVREEPAAEAPPFRHTDRPQDYDAHLLFWRRAPDRRGDVTARAELCP